MVRIPGKAELHDRIVQATIQLGTELGEEGLTMRAIAARLGVSSTVLYQNFDSKAEILREIRLRGIGKLREELLAATGSTPTERLVAMAERYVAWALANPWLYRVLFGGEPVDWNDLGAEERQRLLGPLMSVRDFLEQAKQARAFPPSLHVDHTALMLWAAMHGLTAMLLDGRISERHPVFPVRDVHVFVRSYIEGIVRGLEVPPRTGEIGGS